VLQRGSLGLSILNWQIMEVLRSVNYVLIFVIELTSINLELVLIIVIIICKCQMLQAYD